CGIGINVCTPAFPDELRDLATSIALERGEETSADRPSLDRARLLADALEELERDVERVAHKGLASILPRLERYDGLRGRAVEVEDARGRAEGIDGEGRLLV